MEIGTVLSGIDKFVTTAKPIVEIIAPKLQKSMRGFADRMLELSEKYPSIEEFAKMIDKAADIMGDVLYVLGISAEPSDVIGLKAENSDKTVDDFDSIESYIDYLRDEVELDKERFDSLSTEERVSYSIAGMAIEAGVIGEKLKVDIPADVVEIISKISDIGKIVVDAKELVSIISGLKDDGIDNLNDVCDCIYGVGESDRVKTGESIVRVLDEIHPGDGNRLYNDIIDGVRGD